MGQVSLDHFGQTPCRSFRSNRLWGGLSFLGTHCRSTKRGMNARNQWLSERAIMRQEIVDSRRRNDRVDLLFLEICSIMTRIDPTLPIAQLVSQILAPVAARLWSGCGVRRTWIKYHEHQPGILFAKQSVLGFL